jgi:DNA-binding MarR family transcriptional regulator
MSLIGANPKITREQYAVLVAVRKARAAIPTNNELAKQLGLTPTRVQRLIANPLKHYELRAERA